MVTKIAWLVFIRAKSKGLPNKCYLKLKGSNILEKIVNSAFKEEINPKEIFLCTSRDETCDELCAIAKGLKIKTLRGSEEYPIERITSIESLEKLQKYNTLVRICGDSPFYPFSIVKKAINFYLDNVNNFYAITNVRLRNFPRGMSIEIYNKNFLFELLDKDPSLKKIEHMSDLMTKHIKDESKIIDIKTDINLINLLPNKLTLDNFDDYKNIEKFLENHIENKIKLIFQKTNFL